MRLSDFILAVICALIIVSPLAFFVLRDEANASDKKEFGEVLGLMPYSLSNNTVKRFETPSVQCFIYMGSISCVANK